MLERKPSLTEQAKAYIKQQIVDNAFEGDRIPSETDLASELGVSRTTIRDALSRLENEGAVYRKQGSGTYVNRAGLQIRQRLEEMWSYEAVLRAHGYTPSVQILRMERHPASEEAAEQLQLEEGADVVAVEKLFLEDDEPVIFTLNQVPAQLVPETATPEDWVPPIPCSPTVELLPLRNSASNSVEEACRHFACKAWKGSDFICGNRLQRGERTDSVDEFILPG